MKWAVAKPSHGHSGVWSWARPEWEMRALGRGSQLEGRGRTLRWEPKVWAGSGTVGWGPSPSLLPRVSELSRSCQPHPAFPIYGPTIKVTGPPGP